MDTCKIHNFSKDSMKVGMDAKLTFRNLAHQCAGPMTHLCPRPNPPSVNISKYLYNTPFSKSGKARRAWLFACDEYRGVVAWEILLKFEGVLSGAPNHYQNHKFKLEVVKC